MFWFVARESTFDFPGMVEKWQVEAMANVSYRDTTDEVRGYIDIAAINSRCNPFTLAECVRTANDIMDGKRGDVL